MGIRSFVLKITPQNHHRLISVDEKERERKKEKLHEMVKQVIRLKQDIVPYTDREGQELNIYIL